MIVSFKSEEARAIFHGIKVTHVPLEIQKRATNKMWLMHAASSMQELKSPPSNHLELLHGNRAGQWSIRINRQWRLCFHWKDGNAHAVEIVDYH